MKTGVYGDPRPSFLLSFLKYGKRIIFSSSLDFIKLWSLLDRILNEEGEEILNIRTKAEKSRSVLPSRVTHKKN